MSSLQHLGLSGNPLDQKSIEEYIPTLEVRGVEVQYRSSCSTPDDSQESTVSTEDE